MICFGASTNLQNESATSALNECNHQRKVYADASLPFNVVPRDADGVTFDRWFKIAIIAYVIIEAVCIAVLIYLWL